MRVTCLVLTLLVLGASAPAVAEESAERAMAERAIEAEPTSIAWWSLWQDQLTWEPVQQRPQALEALAVAAARQDIAAWSLAQALVAYEGLSQPERAEPLRQQLGIVHAWSLLGPFPNEGMAGFRSRLEVEEQAVEPDASWPGRARSVAWQALSQPPLGVWIRPGAIAGPEEGSVYFLATALSSDRRGEAWLEVGADGAVWRAWWDGAPLAERDEDWGGPPWRDRVRVRFAEGEHVLVLKVASDERQPAIAVRIVDSQGAAWPLLAQANEGWSSPLQPPEGDWPSPDVAALSLSPESPCDPLEAAAHALALRWLAPRSPGEPWRPWARCALEVLEGSSPRSDAEASHAWWLLAEAAEEPWQAEERLRRAVGSERPDGWVALQLVFRLLERMDLDASIEARARLEEVSVTTSLELPWAMARWFLWREAFARHALLSSMLDRFAPASLPPHVLEALEEIASEVRREDLVLALRSARVAQMGDRPMLWLRALEMADRAGGVPALEAQWQAWLLRMEDDPAWMEAAAELASRRGNLDEAIQRYRRAAERAPGHPDVLDALARVYLRAGEERAAADTFEELLAVAPQRQGARDILERLRASEPSFQDAWREDVARLAETFPEPLDPEADLEWLVDQKVTRVHANGLATAWYQRAARIQTRTGADRMRSIGISFTPDAQRVDVLALRVRRPDGTVRERWSSRDVHYNQGPAAIYFDVQQRVLSVERLDPGDTLEWEYVVADVAFRNLFDDYYGDFRLLQDDVPRRLFRHVVVAPLSRRFATNTPGFEGARWEEVEEGDTRVLKVEVRDVPGVRWEPLSPGPSELGAFVHISTWESWDRLADWYWNLVRDQFILSPEIRTLVANLVEGATTDAERVERIHGWVVDNIRYVSLSFGIHGFRPYRTTECLTRRFGDCKDTAALLKVMLEEAGIPTELVLIRTRDLGRIPVHPPSLAVFNHAIVYVPSLDLWLDGTAAHHHAEETPWLDQAASSLLVHVGRGGTFLESGVMPANASVLDVEMTVDLSGESPAATGRWRATGTHAPPLRRQWEAAEGRAERMERQLQRLAAGVNLQSLEIEGVQPRGEVVEARFSLEGGAWGRRDAAHWHLVPLMRAPSLLERFAPTSSREHPIELEALQTTRERVRWIVPEGARPVDLPQRVEHALPEATIVLAFEWDEASHALEVLLEIEVLALQITVERYPAWRAAWADIERRLLPELVVMLPEGALAREVAP